MRYMDLNDHKNEVYRCRHNYEGFCEKLICPIFINRGRTSITQGVNGSLVGILFILLFYLSEEL